PAAWRGAVGTRRENPPRRRKCNGSRGRLRIGRAIGTRKPRAGSGPRLCLESRPAARHQTRRCDRWRRSAASHRGHRYPEPCRGPSTVTPRTGSPGRLDRQMRLPWTHLLGDMRRRSLPRAKLTENRTSRQEKTAPDSATMRPVKLVSNPPNPFESEYREFLEPPPSVRVQ